jgi:hypothetical protein
MYAYTYAWKLNGFFPQKEGVEAYNAAVKGAIGVLTGGIAE